MDRLETRGQCRVIDESKGLVDMVAATGDVGRDDAILEPSGWELENFRANPIMLWSHDAFSLPVARAVDVQITDEGLTARAEFDLEDPESVRVLGKIVRGFISAVSVRWSPIEARIDMVDGHEVVHFIRQELLEISFVNVPVDPKSLITRSDGSPINVEDYRQADEKTGGGKTEEDDGGETDTNQRMAAVTDALAGYIEQRAERPNIEDQLVAKIVEVTGTDETRARELVAANKE